MPNTLSPIDKAVYQRAVDLTHAAAAANPTIRQQLLTTLYDTLRMNAASPVKHLFSDVYMREAANVSPYSTSQSLVGRTCVKRVIPTMMQAPSTEASMPPGPPGGLSMPPGPPGGGSMPPGPPGFAMRLFAPCVS